MRRADQSIAVLLGVMSLAGGMILFCGAESGPPGPEGAVRPPYISRTLRPPRPIEGGEYYYELGEVHKRYGVYDKAIEMLQMAIEKETDSARKTRYLEALSEAYQMDGKPKEAADQIKNALAAAETVEAKCRYQNALGRIFEQTGELDKAKEAYQFVVENATRDTEKRSARLNLFRLYQRSGELDDLIADIEKKLKEDPGNEEALDTLAQIYNSVAREPAKAIPVYERLSKLRPEDTTLLNRLVYLYQANREYEKAAETYQKIIDASPALSKNYYYQHVSRMYMLAGKKEEAVKWAEKSLSAPGTRPYTYVSVAQTYLQNNMVDEALSLYDSAEQAARRPTEKHQIALRFADLFARHGREEKAEELYKLVLNEATLATFKSQARSKLISLYHQQGRTDEIQELTREEESEETPGQ